MRAAVASMRKWEVLTISAAQVLALLPMCEVIEVNRSAFARLGRGEPGIAIPTRLVLPLEQAGSATLFKPCRIAADSCMGLKVVSVRPSNGQHSLPGVVGSMVLLDDATGMPLAFMDATVLTAQRTAGGSGAITQLLARADASELLVFGAGLQALAHIDAMLVVRPTIRRVRLAVRSMAAATTAVAGLQSEHPDVTFEVLLSSDADAVRAAVGAAHIVVTATPAAGSLFNGDWLSPGTHINAIGSYSPAMRELDQRSIARAAAFSDCDVAALASLTGEYADAPAGSRVVGTIAALLAEAEAGGETLLRAAQSGEGITLFKSIGHSLQDLATAAAVHRAARAAAGSADAPTAFTL